MNNASMWLIPHSSRGDVIKNHGEKLDVDFFQAATDVAKVMSQRTKRKISPGTLIATLATQRGEFYTEVRRQVNQRMQQLRKERISNAKGITTPQQQDQDRIAEDLGTQVHQSS